MINTKLNKALRKNENTVVMLLLLHRPPCDVTVFCAFEIWLPCQLRRGTGNNNWFQDDGAETRKLTAHIPTDYCTLKLTPPHGLRDCTVPVGTAILYEGSMEEL